MSNDKGLISFDYAIKYLLKDKGDFSIVKGFISALLKTKGYKDIKIIALLESESNKEDSKSKRSLADLIVEDEDKNKYIIEVERNFKDSFVHKSLFNTSRLIVDNLAQREDYTQILKVFHISLLYFPIGTGNGAIYHGKTIMHKVETNDKLCVHLKNQETGKIFDATDIFPEYFFISVPLFDDILEQEIDDWLYVMKHDRTPKVFHSPYMAMVDEKLSILKMTPEERANYSYYQKKMHNDRDEIEAALSKGREEGREEGLLEGEKKGQKKGEKKKAIKIAESILQKQEPLEKIAKFTGLSISEVKDIKNR